MRLCSFLVLLTACSTLPARPPADPVPRARPGPDVLALNAHDTADGPRFTLENVSATEQHVLPALDGSMVGWRIPSLTLEWRDAAGEPIPTSFGGGCGNMNGLRQDDFVTLSPGQTLELPGPWGTVHAPAGAAKVRLTYDTASEKSRAVGDSSVDPAVAFARLPKGVWTSEWVAVRPGTRKPPRLKLD